MHRANPTAPERPGIEAGGVLLRMRNLSKTYGGNVVFDGLTAEIRQGEVVLLRGPNGCGKTTLLNILTGYLEPDAGTIEVSSDGSVERMSFPRPWWANANVADHFTPERLARNGVGRTWQELRLFSSQTVLDNVAVASPNQKGENPLCATFRPSTVARHERENLESSRVALADFRLTKRQNSSAEAISLGQSKRVAVARATRAETRLLFLDEPLAGLDGAGVEDAIDVLRDLVTRAGLTLVIVEHVLNIPFVLPIATTVWSLERGLLTVEPAAEVRDAPPQQPLEASVSRCRPASASIHHQPLPGGASLSTVAVLRDTTDTFALEILDVFVRRGGRLVIGTEGADGSRNGLTLRIRRGELAVLRAPNGWGKTTLLHAVGGLLPIEKGEIRMNGRRIDRLPPWERSHLGLSLLQSEKSRFSSLTARETLHLARVSEVPSDIQPFFDRRMATLSGGEAKKVALACAERAWRFEVGFFDEPLTALDDLAISGLPERLAALLDSGALLLAVPSAAQH